MYSILEQIKGRLIKVIEHPSKMFVLDAFLHDSCDRDVKDIWRMLRRRKTSSLLARALCIDQVLHPHRSMFIRVDRKIRYLLQSSW